MEPKVCALFLILAFAACSANAAFTCFKDEKGTETQCKLVNECFVIFNTKTGKKSYGCLTKMTNAQRNYCSRNPDMCVTCEGKNCNKKDLIKLCWSCKTSGPGGNELCTTDPTQLPGNAVKPCKGPCITHAIQDGTNIRGCMKPGDDCEDYSCQECTGELCNNDVFPKSRRVCNTKDGEETCLNARDTCISIVNSQGEAVKLGCTENLFKNTKLKEMCEKNKDRCIECKENKCNGGAKKHKCIVCDESDPNCLDDPQDIETTEDCLGKCYLHIDGDEIKRGCTGKFKCSKETCLECDDEYCTQDQCYAA